MNWDIIRLYRLPFLLGLSGVLFFMVSFFIFITPYMHRPPEQIDIVHEDQKDEQAQELLVDIQGAVKNPGLFQMAEGSRVSDLLEKAGGLREDADAEWAGKYLNRAQKLADGGKLYIPVAGEHIDSQNVLGSASSLVNINTASTAELEGLPGIGEKTAEKIASSRPYGSIEELLEKEVIGRSVFEKIRELVTVM